MPRPSTNGRSELEKKFWDLNIRMLLLRKQHRQSLFRCPHAEPREGLDQLLCAVRGRLSTEDPPVCTTPEPAPGGRERCTRPAPRRSRRKS